jgi:hypothetical protein
MLGEGLRANMINALTRLNKWSHCSNNTHYGLSLKQMSQKRAPNGRA